MADLAIAQRPLPILTPFAFQALTFRESAWVNDRPYFTRRAIGEWLEYRQPQVAIDKIIARNPHLLDPRWSLAVTVAEQNFDPSPHPNLGCGENRKSVPTRLRSTDGKYVRTTLFDPIGFQMIVFESRQPRALQFKLAVAHLVVAYLAGELVPARCLPGVRGVLFYPKWSRARAEAQRALMAEHGWSLSQVRYRLDRVRRGLPEMGRPGFRYVTKRYATLQPEALRLRRHRLTLREIAERLHVPQSTVGYWAQRAQESQPLMPARR